MNLEQFKVKEKIKLAHLKHRGNCQKVADETGLDINYIYKVVTKLKKEESRDVQVLIANNITQYVMQGHNQRVVYLMEMLEELSKEEVTLLSVCCGAPVRKVIPPGYPDLYNYVCLNCHHNAEVAIPPKKQLFKIKAEIVEKMRKEDEALVNFAAKMGYIGGDAPPPAPNIKANVLVVQNRDGLSKDDQDTLEMIEELPIHERQKIIRQLEERFSKMVDSDKPEIIDTEGEEGEQVQQQEL